VLQVGYLQGSYQDARSTKHEIVKISVGCPSLKGGDEVMDDDEVERMISVGR
jgi:hypothetical protein